MFVRSPNATSPAGRVAASLLTGALSPVSAASCTSSVAEAMTRPSAGTTSPASNNAMSPGTSPIASISSTRPDRRTRAWGTCSWARASTLARALSSWRDPITTLKVTRSATKMPVATCPMAMLATATIASMMFIGFASCPSATDQRLGGGSVVNWFGPYSASLRAASSSLNPWSVSTVNRAATSSGEIAYHAGVSELCSIVLMSAPSDAAVRPDPASAKCLQLCVVVVASSRGRERCSTGGSRRA